MTDINLNALKSGINRLRTKGGADPSSLYDLVDGYVTIDGSIQSRPGTVSDATLLAGTKGLCAFNGGMVVFSSLPKDGMPDGYICAVLIHPSDDTQDIVEIHFAAPFMGFLYVVAEFENGDVFHYWLQTGTPWTANTVYKTGDLVAPTTPNGFLYKVASDSNPVVWEPNTQYQMGDVVQPSVYNGYKYTVVEMDGTNPSSGATEPEWIAQDAALVNEDVDTSSPTTTPTTPSGGSPAGPRYDNPAGKVVAE